MVRLSRIVHIGAVLCMLLAWSAGPAQRNDVQSVNAAPQETVITLTSGQRILYSGLAAADFNGDGRKEIVAGGGDGKLHIVSTSNGTTWTEVWVHDTNSDIEAAGPPTHKATTEIYSTPAIADLDNDGHLDIVVAVGGDIHVTKDLRENGGVLVYRYNSAWNFSLIESLSPDGSRGWPQPRIDRCGDDSGYGSPDGYWDGIVTAPALGDLDGDGDLEIVVGGIDRRIWAWHHNGQLVDGWPIYRNNGDNLLRGGLSSPALGDIDGDSLPEIVVGTMSPPWDGVHNPDYTKATIWAINGDSTNVSGFPFTSEQVVHSSPALGDLDSDGQLEIVVGVGWGTTGRTNIMYGLQGNGTTLPGWGPLATSSSSDILYAAPALGDIDNDGKLEVVMGCGNSYDSNSCGAPHAKLYAWNAENGTPVTGFPKEPPSPNNWLNGSYAMPYTPILADIDGDGHIEILVVHLGASGITVVDAVDGAMDKTSHLFSGGLSAPPLVDDVDNDGKFEVLAGGGATDQATSNAVIRIWDETGSATGAQPWPMFRHDVRRTGRLLPPKLGFPSELRFFHQQGSGSTETLYTMVRNLGGDQFRLGITDTMAALQVVPASGTVFTQTTVQLSVTTTGYLSGWTKLGDLGIAGSYTGTVVQSSPMTVPVWLYVGDVSRVYLPLVLRNYQVQ